MDKFVAAIEFGSKKLKLAVGYELNGQVYVLYTLTKAYGKAIDAGHLIDPASISNSVLEVKEFSDTSAKLRLTISDAILCIPPYGLEVFETSETTTVLSDACKIGSYDIRNLYALMKNRGLPQSSDLIDVVPRKYLLDDDREFDSVPYGEASNYISIYAKLHVAPSTLVNDYRNALKASGMQVKRLVMAPFGAAELISTYPDLPSDYILVDIGSDITTVSLVGSKDLYASRYFEWGGDNITDRIAEMFNISLEDAEKYKIMYGLDNREMNFKAPVCTSTDEEGIETHHYQEELLSIIKNELENFLRRLKTSIEDLVSFDPSLKSLPMLLIGGGSALNGFENYLGPKVDSDYVKVVSSQTLGARNPTFFNCLGMILVNSKYPNLFEETQHRIGEVTRDPLGRK